MCDLGSGGSAASRESDFFRLELSLLSLLNGKLDYWEKEKEAKKRDTQSKGGYLQETVQSRPRGILRIDSFPRIIKIVDMRWGVRDEATDDHMTTTICLEEVRNCRLSSIGPNFIFFGGTKYGYRPIPTVIECDEFEKIQKTIRDMERDGKLLTEWY